MIGFERLDPALELGHTIERRYEHRVGDRDHGDRTPMSGIRIRLCLNLELNRRPLAQDSSVVRCDPRLARPTRQ